MINLFPGATSDVVAKTTDVMAKKAPNVSQVACDQVLGDSAPMIEVGSSVDEGFLSIGKQTFSLKG